jgi:hypothetical protein
VGKVYDVTVANKYYYWRPFGKEEEIKIAYYVIKEDDLGHKGYIPNKREIKQVR